MGKQHLDLLSKLHRDLVLAGLGDVAYDLARVFVFLAGDRSGIGVRAAFLFRWAGLAGQFQRAVFGGSLAGWAAVRVRIVAAELFERMSFRADILVVLGVPFKVGPGPCPIGAAGFVEDRDVRCDALVTRSVRSRRQNQR